MHQVTSTSLAFPCVSCLPHAFLHSPVEREYWVGIDILNRLKYCLLGGCISIGEIVSVLLILPSLFRSPGHLFLSGGIAEISSAALFFGCSALYGDIVLTCW